PDRVEAPQWPDGRGPGRVPGAVPPVRGPRGWRAPSRAEARRGTAPDRPGGGGVTATPRPVRLASASDGTLPCPIGVCDGSGWILGPEDVARPCECRERRMARRRARGVASAIPRKYRGVSLDRPPISDMAR